MKDAARQTPHADPPALTGPGEADLHCLVCGYDLRGLTAPRCPECGTPFDRSEPTGGWGPLVWERSQPLPPGRRLWLTFVGLLLHPAGSLRQLGDVPRAFGRGHLRLLAWLVVLGFAMATLATGMGLLAYQILIRLRRLREAIPGPELWLRYQIEWLDALIVPVLHGGIALLVAAILWMVNRRADPYRELAVLGGLFGLALTAGLLAPAPAGSVPVLLAAAGTVGLVVYHAPSVPWSTVVPVSARGLIYFAALFPFVHLALTAADWSVALANVWWGPRAWVVNAAARGQTLARTGVLSVLTYWLLRGVYRTDRLRAAGAVLVYAVLAELWLIYIDMMQSPLICLAERSGLIRPR